MSKNNPLVSIMIPVFNREEYVGQAIKSVLNQTYKNFELIIHDDASTDNTLSVIKSFTDPRIRIIHTTTNHGMIGGWNYLLGKAKGVYVKQMGSDDLLAPKCIELEVSALQNNPKAALVTCQRQVIGGNGEKLTTYQFDSKSVTVSGRDHAHWILTNLRENKIGEPCAAMFPRELIKQAGMFDSQFSQFADFEYWIRILEFGELVYIHKPLCSFRTHPGSNTSAAIRDGRFITEIYAAIDKYYSSEHYRDVFNLSNQDHHFVLRQKTLDTLKNIKELLISGKIKIGYRYIVKILNRLGLVKILLYISEHYSHKNYSTERVIAVYSNLPSGGAKYTENSTVKFLRKYYKVKQLIEPDYKVKNIFQYMYLALIKSPINQKKLISACNHNLLICYHSWLVKTPSILRYTKTKKIYICHEPLREYYDKEHIALQSIKERIVNTIRLPIKWLDYINIKTKDLTIIANSEFSKKLIDRAYKVNSKVIYPGIDITKYSKKIDTKINNQVICVSAINKYKRQDFIVDVIANIKVQERPLLVLIGNGADKEYLNQIKNKAKAKNVVLKIIINASDEIKLLELNKSKVFIYAPINEPFGIVIEEAIALGLPIVTYSYGGGYSEIISSQNGTIINNLNPKEWAEEITTILKNKMLRISYSKYNIKYATERFDSIIMNEQILEIAKSLL